MAVRNDFTAGEVLAAADLNDTFLAKANLASPTFTGTPAGPTAAAGTNTTQLATTAFVQGAGGLVLITAETFSAVSSVSINGCFTATYNNYKILVETTASANSNLLMRLRASGSDNTGTDYRWSGTFTGSGDATYSGETGAAFTGFAIGFNDTVGPSTTALDLFSPFLSVRTTYHANNIRISSTTSNENRRLGGIVVTTSYDGATFLPTSGTFSGTVRIYGYKN
jgi:hypothetical protein